MREIRQKASFYWEVLRESLATFLGEDMPTHAAALSYYMIFSLPSMLLVVLWSAAAFYGEAAVREAIFTEFSTLVGVDGAQQVMAALEKPSVREPSLFSTIVALLVLFVFATSVFDAMRTSLNRITQVNISSSVVLGIWRLVRVRFIAFALLVSLSFLMIVFLMLDALLTTAAGYLVSRFGEVARYLLFFDAFLLDILASAILFALYFRYLPDLRLEWRHIRFGALLTALLIAAGKWLISRFIGSSEAADLYEAAGSLLVLMLWVYYAAAIFFFGATFAYTRARLLES